MGLSNKTQILSVAIPSRQPEYGQPLRKCDSHGIILLCVDPAGKACRKNLSGTLRNLLKRPKHETLLDSKHPSRPGWAGGMGRRREAPMGRIGTEGLERRRKLWKRVERSRALLSTNFQQTPCVCCLIMVNYSQPVMSLGQAQT